MPGTPAKATLTAYQPPTLEGEPPGGAMGGPVTFQFNPHTLTLSKGTNWLQNPATKMELGTAEFRGRQPAKLSVELFLDATANHDNSVATAVDTVLSWCSPVSEEIGLPPWVKFAWGSFKAVEFYGYLESVTATYTLFDIDGHPLRATCAVQITEAAEMTKGQNPTSGALSARRVHQVVGGDSLELLAYREYGDATAWRRIAEANAIDDPMRLRPGVELLVPARDERQEG
ncbi:peptidase M23 [Kitasatospora sp. NPDC058965]|uniref:CIS tube protein n=1 Tax=Kitasatospora sp. NPDC058965 TaxID=3346682 RepID=UPI0036B05EFC